MIEKTAESCKIGRILTKFETDRRFIHVYYAPGNTLIFELPRFDLSFSLRFNQGNEYVIKSNNYRDFQLTRQQQLDDTLWGFN